MERIDTMESIERKENPVGGIQVNFRAYVDKMRRKDDIHRVGGIPDYAFAFDYKLREQLRKIPFFYTLSKKVAVMQEARFRQMMTADAIQAGPRQFSDIYNMAIDCAKRLGIGAPNVFIRHDQSINASTYASDTVTPTIILNSGTIERLTMGELKCIIGHECGHVHNEHMIYTNICDLISGIFVGSGVLLQMLSASYIILFGQWQRAAEITCDRAGMICADNIQDAINVNKKLAYGTFFDREEELDIEDIRNQFGELSTVMSVVTEIGQGHPSSIRRVLASDEFSHCDILYQWRPELKKAGMTLNSKEETDRKCEKYTALVKEPKGGKKS